jgi:hypothetical protein
MTRDEEIELIAKGSNVDIADIEELLDLIDPNEMISPIKAGLAWKDFCKSYDGFWLDPRGISMGVFAGWLLTKKVL